MCVWGRMGSFRICGSLLVVYIRLSKKQVLAYSLACKGEKKIIPIESPGFCPPANWGPILPRDKHRFQEYPTVQLSVWPVEAPLCHIVKHSQSSHTVAHRATSLMTAAVWLAYHTSIVSAGKETVSSHGFEQCITYVDSKSKISMVSAH